MDSPVTLDFETDGIQPWPEYPPKPVGLAVRWPDGRSEYLSYGHPEGNTHTRGDVETVLHKVWDDPILFHSSNFDVEVAMKEFGLPYPKRVHDTLFQLYLEDPHAPSLSLKPSATRVLGIPNDEQKDLENYIRSHISNTKEWGAHISKAPVRIVAPYAIGDVERTFLLHQHLHPKMEANGVIQSYNRELRLQPILLEATRRGIRCDVERLALDIARYDIALTQADNMLRTRLGSPNLNVSSNEELADALDRAGVTGVWPTTPTGRRSTSKEALRAAVTAPDVIILLAYRGTLETCLTTFMKPWLTQAASTGRCHPSWNQVRGEKYGTRTGRLSSSAPNFQNVPNEFEDLVIPEGFPPPPLMRNYLLPEPGMTWGKRDYSQQELRVLAHFEDGSLLQAYTDDPRLDVHEYASQLILKYTGNSFNRKATKIVSFTLVYGGGIPALSGKLKSGPGEAMVLKESYLSSFPDIRKLMNDVKACGRNRKAVRTTGGRLLYAERSADGRDHSYKLLNHLIQGSSADITKQSIINWHEHPDRSKDDLFLATVHDENDFCFPEGEEKRAMRVMGEAMLDVPLDVPLLSEGFIGPTWGEVQPFPEEGPYV
jgi:DNA polymerase-1